MKLGFCGLGLMGTPMAARLVQAEHHVVVWNRSPGKAEPLVRLGAVEVSSPAEAASDVDAVFTMLATPAALEEVVFGDSGIAVGVRPGSTLIEMSTIGPDAVRAIARRLPDGVEMVDAPVLGSVPEVKEGSLTIFIGSSDEMFGRFQHVFSALGSPVRIGPLGSGAAMKLVVNLTLGAIQLAFGEALALSDALGLDVSKTLDVLEGSPIGPTVKKKRQKLETGIFEPNFKLELAAKDMRLVTDAARAARAQLSGAEAARSAFESAAAAGLGGCDYSAVAAFLSKREARSS
jgi:3-hydroxyisobutyrate dehydrogenase-like beta-hydroxyacid dehydrogenase